MQYIHCLVCEMPVVPGEEREYPDGGEDVLLRIHKTCDWTYLARCELNSKELQQREQKWGGKPRDCPKCSFRFTSVQDLGVCPSCGRAFYASEPSTCPPERNLDDPRQLAREKEVVFHLEQLKEQLVESFRAWMPLCNLYLNGNTIQSIAKLRGCSVSEMEEHRLTTRSRVTQLSAKIHEVVSNWDAFAATLDLAEYR